MNSYFKKFLVKCPNDSDSIEYTLTIESDHMIMVEDINEVLETFTKSETGEFHEDMALFIHNEITGRQVLTATHQGVRVRTVHGTRELRNL